MAVKKSELYSTLWASCDELRGGMEPSQYKDYVLLLLFVRYVSDKSKFDNNLNIFIQFILTKILKFDELFTNFNYAQLKQMFNEDKFDMNTPFQENEEYDNEDDDDLFGYNDLNIQFEDEEPFDN